MFAFSPSRIARCLPSKDSAPLGEERIACVLELVAMENKPNFERVADGVTTYTSVEGRRLTGFGRTEDEALADLRAGVEMDERLTALMRESKRRQYQEQR